MIERFRFLTEEEVINLEAEKIYMKAGTLGAILEAKPQTPKEKHIEQLKSIINEIQLSINNINNFQD